MLPVIATTALNSDKAKKVKQSIHKNGKKAIPYLGVALSVGLGVHFFKKYLKKANYNKMISQFGNYSKEGYATRFATILYSALFPTAEWISDFFGDGTDNKAIFSIAYQMRDKEIPLSLVEKAYSKLHNRQLTKDLLKDLSSKEFQKFTTIITSSKDAVPDQQKRVVVNSFNGETIYKKVGLNRSWIHGYGRDPILKLSNKTYLGTLTGNVRKGLVEVSVKLMSKYHKFWVDHSQVTILTDTDYYSGIASGSILNMTQNEKMKIVTAHNVN